MMKIPTADEAREAIAKGQYEKAQKQAAEVEALIAAAVAAGHSCVGGDGALQAPIADQLKGMGYKLILGAKYGEPCWTISWASAHAAARLAELVRSGVGRPKTLYLAK